MPYEVVIEREIEVAVEHLVEKPVFIDNMIRKEVGHIVEIPVPVE